MSEENQFVSEIFGAEGWLRSARLRLLDFDVAIHSDDHEVVSLVNDLYAPLRTTGRAQHALLLGTAARGGRPGYFAALDGEMIVRTPARSVAFAHLVFEANQQAIGLTRDLVRVHAAAASFGHQAVILPGPMGAGKSTLVAGLMARGATYLTDEVAALDPATGLVLPYPKPLSLGPAPALLKPIEWEPSTTARSYLGAGGVVPAHVLGPSIADSGVPLGLVVLPRYVPSAPTEIVRISQAEALASVAAHTFSLDHDAMLSNLAQVLAGVSCYCLISGDLAAAVDSVLELCRAEFGPP